MAGSPRTPTGRQTHRRRAPASIVQSSHDAIVGESLDGSITSWNPGAERLYGYTAEEMIGRPLDVVIPPDSKDDEAAMLGRWAWHRGQARRGVRVVPCAQGRSPHRCLGQRSQWSPMPTTSWSGWHRSRETSRSASGPSRFAGSSRPHPTLCSGSMRTGASRSRTCKAERLFGYAAPELIGQPVEILVPDGGTPRAPGHRARLLRRPRRPADGGGHAARRAAQGRHRVPGRDRLSALETEDGRCRLGRGPRRHRAARGAGRARAAKAAGRARAPRGPAAPVAAAGEPRPARRRRRARLQQPARGDPQLRRVRRRAGRRPPPARPGAGDRAA